MNRSEREKLEAEREARRAKRLSERAKQRAKRQAEEAEQASRRAEELARRAERRHPRHRRGERSIEDVVDDVAERWSRKAEAWMDEQSKKMFSDSDEHHGMGSDYGMHDGMHDEFDDGSLDDEAMSSGDYRDMDDGEPADARRRQADAERQERRAQRAKRRRARMKAQMNGHMTRRWKRRNRNGNLYRNSKNKKICGVCAGIADYWGMETWQVRLMAVFALFTVPSIAVPGYFIAYFLMDDKPYYRTVTDRFHELDEEEAAMTDAPRTPRRPATPERNRKSGANKPTQVNNTQALRAAKRKFADIEDRLRVMETHVTSPRFELQRELKKIAGDEA